MQEIELLFLKFFDDGWLNELEINLSQELSFRVNEEGKLIVSAKESVNLFDGSIKNLNVIVGRNGVGKTTILNEIFELLHGPVDPNRLVIIKKESSIFIYQGLQRVIDPIEIININNTYKNYKFVISEDAFYLNDKIDNLEIDDLIYISHAADFSVKQSTHKLNQNYGFNFSPFLLISQPDTFYDYSMKSIKSKLKATTETFKLINLIHQVEFLSNNNIDLGINIPDKVSIDFRNLIFQLNDERKEVSNNGFMNLYINDILKTNDQFIKKIYKIMFVIAVANISDVSQYSIDWQFAQEKFKLFTNLEDKKRQIEKIFNTKIKNILEDYCNQLIELNLFKEKYCSILDDTKIEYFYFDEQTNEPLSIKVYLDEIVNTYRALCDFQNFNNKNDGRVIINIEQANNYFSFYTLLYSYTTPYNINYNINIFPSKIEYSLMDRPFYFSTGEEHILRLFTYINIAVNVSRKTKTCSRYSFILLIDEPDNSLNPDLQKLLIYKINNFLNNYLDCSFHIIMTTHSPIVTGDLTSNHLIYLEKKDGKVVTKEDKPRTFAQNIYQLYRESFFIKNGLIGKFANEFLGNLYKQINKEKIEQHVRKFSDSEIKIIINEIGEQLIRQKFEEAYALNNSKIEGIKRIIKELNLNEESEKKLISMILEQMEINYDRD